MSGLHRITKFFVIGNETREPERIQYLKSYFESKGISNVEYYQPTWQSNLVPDELANFTEKISSKPSRPFKASEQSIFLNYYYLLQHILKCYDNGNFCIFESDVRFDTCIREYLDGLEPFFAQVHPRLVSIGSGCDLIHDDINTDDMNFQIYPKPVVRCMDSFIWSYEGIRDFLAYCKRRLQRGELFDLPIDNFLDVFLKRKETDPTFQYWIWPSLTTQGSQNGTYPSLIQDTV